MLDASQCDLDTFNALSPEVKESVLRVIYSCFDTRGSYLTTRDQFEQALRAIRADIPLRV